MDKNVRIKVGSFRISFGREFGKEFMKFNKVQAMRNIYDISDAIAGFFFPHRCPLCDCLLEPEKFICSGCDKKPLRIKEPSCKRCGKPLKDERREYCGDCQRSSHGYKQGKAVFVYEGEIRRSMYRFKYGNKREYAAFYAKEAAGLYQDWVLRHNIEVIVPIPMYSRKKRLRGYNQAEVFAAALGRELGISVDRKLVKRIRNTVPLKELNPMERRSNLKNAFQLMQDIVKYRQILLVDDIYTTGSTMDVVSKLLLSAGANEIYFICISIGEGY